MDKCCVPLSKAICDKIQPGIYERLISEFPDIKVIDVDAFVAQNKYEPAIGSIFLVIAGGSIVWYTWSTINGTLAFHRDFPVGALQAKYLYHLKGNPV